MAVVALIVQDTKRKKINKGETWIIYHIKHYVYYKTYFL